MRWRSSTNPGLSAAGTRDRHANVTSGAESNRALNTAGRPECLPAIAGSGFPFTWMYGRSCAVLGR